MRCGSSVRISPATGHPGTSPSVVFIRNKRSIYIYSFLPRFFSSGLPGTTGLVHLLLPVKNPAECRD
jgi:hypothetical protein